MHLLIPAPLRITAVVIVGFALLATFHSVTWSVDVGSAPASGIYKPQIENEIVNMHADPYSLRSVQVSQPTLVEPVFGYTDNNSAWAICLRYNPKNEYGAYAGMHTAVFYFRQDEIFWRFTTQMDAYGINQIARQGFLQEAQFWLDAGYDFQGVVQEVVPYWIASIFSWAHCKDAVWSSWPDINQID